MKIQSVFDPSFAVYGKVLTGYDLTQMIGVLDDISKPASGVDYVPGCEKLESLPVCTELRDRQFGGMPVQIGYCIGSNTLLNCLEYHRDSEVNIFASDAIVLIGRQQDIKEGKYDTAKVEAFLVPAGSAVEYYATTLHYAPCDAKKGCGFCTAVALPQGTNTDKPVCDVHSEEDKMLFARNKWLLAFAGTAEASQGAYVGLTGVNIDIRHQIV